MSLHTVRGHAISSWASILVCGLNSPASEYIIEIWSGLTNSLMWAVSHGFCCPGRATLIIPCTIPSTTMLLERLHTWVGMREFPKVQGLEHGPQHYTLIRRPKGSPNFQKLPVPNYKVRYLPKPITMSPNTEALNTLE